jgi:hypothetical protein
MWSRIEPNFKEPEFFRRESPSPKSFWEMQRSFYKTGGSVPLYPVAITGFTIYV